MEDTSIRDFALFIADTLSDKKAHDINVLDVGDLVGYAAYFVVCAGRSDRQVKALADWVQRHAREVLQRRPLGVEGVERGQWALLDFGDVVVHVFREQERAFYDLEGLWEDAPRVPWTPPEAERPAAQA
jgi:ribosome-associated protein